MTSEDEKTVHQQSISERTEAEWDAFKERDPVGWALEVEDGKGWYCQYNSMYGSVGTILKAEVLRLREELKLEEKTAFGLAQEVDELGEANEKLREVVAQLANSSGDRLRAEYETQSRLRAKLARVEAVFGELFDREVGGEKVSTYDAIEAFRLALIE